MTIWPAVIVAIGIILGAADVANAIRDSAKSSLVSRAWGGGHDA